MSFLKKFELGCESKVGGGHATVVLISFTVLSFFVWAAFAPLKIIVRAGGMIVPELRNQVVQNLEGGILQEIFTAEGDIVRAGQLIVEMDDTRFRSAVAELENQRMLLTARLARLEVERGFASGSFSDAIGDAADTDYGLLEQQLYLARRSRYEISLNNLSLALENMLEQERMLGSLVVSGAAAQMDLLRVRREVLEIRSRLDGLIVEFEADRAQEHADILAELRRVEEQLRAREDQLRRTNVESPINGIVNRVLISTIGGVVQPGEGLIEITSLEGELRVQGRVRPEDIGFVYIGMPANIKLTAFDFTIYGSLSGHVVHIGADTISDERQPETEYYEVEVSLDYVDNEQLVDLSIRPGMQAEIELQAGERTVLQYLITPLSRASEALTER